MSKKWILLSLFLISCSSSKYQDISTHCFAIPIHYFSCTDSPLIKAVIEGKEYNLKIDLGANFDFQLKKNVLNEINGKVFQKSVSLIDVQNNQYESNDYKMPPIKIGRFEFENRIATEEDDFFTIVGSKPFGSNKYRTDKQLQLIDGRIGCAAFSDSVCFFNLPHSIFCIASNVNDMKQDVVLDDFADFDFDFSKDLVCLEFSTEHGKKKFILDTGASHSIIDRSCSGGQNKMQINSLQLGSKDFGPWKFYCLDIPEKIGINGILGIDFFDKFAICIDFPNRKIYLK